MPDNNDNLSDLLNSGGTTIPKPPAPAPGDHFTEDEAADSSPALRYDPSAVTQGFSRRQRDKILELLQHPRPDLERIQDLYLAHVAGQFHIVGLGEWHRFFALLDGLHTLDPCFRKGSILFGGWKGEGIRLTPPTSISDNVTAFSDLKEFHGHFVKLEVYNEAVRLQRLYKDTLYQRDLDSLKSQFDDWAKQHHGIFRPTVFINDSFEKMHCSQMTMDEIDEFVRSGRFADLQDKAEGWILQLSRLKAIHFLPGNTPQGWEEFHWFCRVFNLFAKPDPAKPDELNLYKLNPRRLRYYFLIQLPSA